LNKKFRNFYSDTNYFFSERSSGVKNKKIKDFIFTTAMFSRLNTCSPVGLYGLFLTCGKKIKGVNDAQMILDTYMIILSSYCLMQTYLSY
jgi:hypothetical protein